MEEAKFKNVLLKISGDFFASPQVSPIDCDSLLFLSQEIQQIYRLGLKISIVVGGGNVVRGNSLYPHGLDRYTADFMGMLATVINGMALKSYLNLCGVPASLYSALEIEGVVPPFNKEEIIKELERGKVILLAGGTGNPFFTTDTAAALRAVEIGAEVLLKGTKVRGIYDSDPLENPQAKFFPFLTYEEVLQKGLKIMDLSAITLCRENHLPIIVFNMREKGNLKKVIMGEKIGSKVGEK